MRYWMIPFIGVSIAFAMILLIAFPIMKSDCKNISKNTGKETHLDYRSGCYIKINGEFVPISNWRVNGE